MNQQPRGLCIPPSTLSFACFALLIVATVRAQDRAVPAGQSNSNSANKTHVATVRSSESSEGSRVAITSDQSLNNYEAYRRGDRFYVKIPAADVSRAESARGRGFADVKSQRNGDSTVLSFRLDPGATAHVEQRDNKLDVVVSVPGGTPANAAADRAPDVTSQPGRETSRGGEANQRGSVKITNPSAGGNKGNGASAGVLNAAPGNENENLKPGSASSSPANPNSAATGATTPANSTPGTPLQSQGSAGVQTVPSPVGPQSSPLTNTSTAPSQVIPATQPISLWTRAKERGHYWLLLAQLNPVPVALGAILLAFVIMFLLFQRRGARATRRVNPIKDSPKRDAMAASAAAAGTKPAVRAKTATVVTGARSRKTESVPVTSPPQPATTMATTAATSNAISSAEDSPQKRLSRAREEAQKIFAGDGYDENYVGSEDPETRRLVGAELLSALVSRNAMRRDRARAAFMKHGYFDDATRDLRIAASANERAAAARRLSFINDREATPHLVGALSDTSPDVRRAAVEALMDMRDPAAIGPLNALLQNEKDPKVPGQLIQNAITACATSPEPARPVESAVSPALTAPATLNTDREVIEI